ncbi:hypothetical protein EDD11_003877 [Mortierella claussenii]|nr:hypothetical protein EDD11_003877 [Mortierella claussenii]
MFIKSTAVAILALAASVSAQTPALNHTYFTNPVTDGLSYPQGSSQTFSWSLPCTAPSTWVAKDPTQVNVELLNSNDPNNAFYLQKVTTIDCSKTSGNVQWTVPSDVGTDGFFSLRIAIDTATATQNAYSGRFHITAPGGKPASPSTTGSQPAPTTGGKSAANSVAPVLSGAAAVVAAAALLL